MWNETVKHKPAGSAQGVYNFRYYIMAGNAHATDQIKPFYTRESNGVPVVQWVGDFVGNGMTPNSKWKNIWPEPVKAPDCRGSGDQCENPPGN
jgi:hypothetical protein